MGRQFCVKLRSVLICLLLRLCFLGIVEEGFSYRTEVKLFYILMCLMSSSALHRHLSSVLLKVANSLINIWIFCKDDKSIVCLWFEQKQREVDIAQDIVIRCLVDYHALYFHVVATLKKLPNSFTSCCQRCRFSFHNIKLAF